MRELGHEVLRSVERYATGKTVRAADCDRMRAAFQEAREVFFDAGYPAEAVWRGIQRAAIGLETLYGEPDRFYWEDAAAELRQGLEALDALLSSGSLRDIDLHIVG